MSEFSPQKRRADERHKELAKPLAARDIHSLPLLNDFVKEHHTTLGTISKVRSTAAYKDARAYLLQKQSKILGKEFKELTLEVKGKLRDYSNKAVDVLHEVMMDEDAPKPARISAATELLDRDGRFAKVSRQMLVKEGADGAPMLPEDAAAQMLDALRAAKKEQIN